MLPTPRMPGHTFVSHTHPGPNNSMIGRSPSSYSGGYEQRPGSDTGRRNGMSPSAYPSASPASSHHYQTSHPAGPPPSAATDSTRRGWPASRPAPGANRPRLGRANDGGDRPLRPRWHVVSLKEWQGRRCFSSHLTHPPFHLGGAADPPYLLECGGSTPFWTFQERWPFQGGVKPPHYTGAMAYPALSLYKTCRKRTKAMRSPTLTGGSPAVPWGLGPARPGP